ncbi:uncharacterized protein LOC124293234 isoform X2 [Neodiprion lecontei]|uniref:Telomeric repeat-binding factor 2-interacting protein 1 n=1 Tax=Neodiprion lecontei TaxID=441921 RepID=A0ABM3FMM3_NEOLC|nr:uncharacterized protein LOC124293234 isoform X2 [Neodiprion lecontei]
MRLNKDAAILSHSSKVSELSPEVLAGRLDVISSVANADCRNPAKNRWTRLNYFPSKITGPATFSAKKKHHTSKTEFDKAIKRRTYNPTKRKTTRFSGNTTRLATLLCRSSLVLTTSLLTSGSYFKFLQIAFGRACKNITINMLFEHLGRPIKFHLVNVSDKEKLELSRLITANGGVVSEDSLIKFTIRNPHVGNEEVYHVNFIHNCVKQNKILDITKYRHGAMGIGCPMSQFLRGSTSCMVDSDASEDNRLNQPSCSIRTRARRFVSKSKPFIQERLTRKSENEVISLTDSDSDASEDNRLNQPSCSIRTRARRFVSKSKPFIQERLTRKSENEVISLTDSDSDASEARPDLLLRSRKNNFRTWEKQKMVNYLIENNLISQARGNRVWKRMIDKGLLKHRTFHSLNNHFRKYMLPNIHLYKMDSKSLAKFLRLKM